MVLRGQDENVVLLCRDGPTSNMFGGDLAREWLRASEATSSHASVAANNRGRRKRKAAPPSDAITPARTPSGRIFRKDRRDLSGFVCICALSILMISIIDAEVFNFLPELHSALRLGRITLHR
jgi:hypothetical protein